VARLRDVSEDDLIVLEMALQQFGLGVCLEGDAERCGAVRCYDECCDKGMK
jgi:hypothetical protein